MQFAFESGIDDYCRGNKFGDSVSYASAFNFKCLVSEPWCWSDSFKLESGLLSRTQSFKDYLSRFSQTSLIENNEWQQVFFWVRLCSCSELFIRAAVSGEAFRSHSLTWKINEIFIPCSFVCTLVEGNFYSLSIRIHQKFILHAHSCIAPGRLSHALILCSSPYVVRVSTRKTKKYYERSRNWRFQSLTNFSISSWLLIWFKFHQHSHISPDTVIVEAIN